MRAAILVIALATASRLPAAAVEDELRNAEKAWATAVVARDIPALEKIYAESLIYAHSTGNIEDRQQYLDRLRGGNQRYEGINHEKIRVVTYGDSAVVHSIVRMHGVSNAKPFNDHLMMLHLWVKQGGRWRLAAHQTTKLPS